jgi:putative PIN family toxin of toxin-antitoxin system
MKITADTNVLISGTFWKGYSFEILEKAKNNEIELFLSEEIIKEYERVLSYGEVIQKISLNIKYINHFSQFVVWILN